MGEDDEDDEDWGGQLGDYSAAEQQEQAPVIAPPAPTMARLPALAVAQAQAQAQQLTEPQSPQHPPPHYVTQEATVRPVSGAHTYRETNTLPGALEREIRDPQTPLPSIDSHSAFLP